MFYPEEENLFEFVSGFVSFVSLENVVDIFGGASTVPGE